MNNINNNKSKYLMYSDLNNRLLIIMYVLLILNNKSNSALIDVCPKSVWPSPVQRHTNASAYFPLNRRRVRALHHHEVAWCSNRGASAGAWCALAHSPTETDCVWKREAVRSCVLCCCRAVSFHASAEDYKGKVDFRDAPTNGHGRSQIPLNARSVWADSAFIPMLQRRIVADIKSCIVGTVGTDCCTAVCYLVASHESRFGDPWSGNLLSCCGKMLASGF